MDGRDIVVSAVKGTIADTVAADAAVVVVCVVWLLVVDGKACVCQGATGRMLPGMSLLPRWLTWSLGINRCRLTDGPRLLLLVLPLP